MDKSRVNKSKSNSAIRDRKSLKNNKDSAKIHRTVIKKRGVYVEKFTDNGMDPKNMEGVPQGSNKKLIESVLIILTKSSKATQWPDENYIRKNILKIKNNKSTLQFMNKKVEGKERKTIVFKPNTAVNKTTVAKSQYAARKSPLAKTKNPADKTPPAKHKVALDKTALTKSKITVNKTTVAKSKTAVSKTAPKTIPETTTAQTIKPKFVARRVKRLLLRKASPDNTLISDKIIKERPMENLNNIETESEDKLDNTDHDAKIYSLIKDFLETTINTCSDNPSDKSDLNLHIDEEVAMKLMIKNENAEDDSEDCLFNCPDTKDSSSTTIRKHIENNVSRISEKSQENRKVSAECMTEVRIQRKDNIKSKKCGKNITKPIIIAKKTNSLEQSKQKMQRKSAPVPKFVNRSDYLVQHIYNIQLDSHTLKTKKFELVKQLKNPSVFQRPQNFFETLSLILKNKNNTQNLNNNMESKFQNLKKLTKTKKKLIQIKEPLISFSYKK